MLSLKFFVTFETCIQVTEDPVPFGLAAFDALGNEFDTLDGVQLAWFIGSDKEIAEIQAGFRQEMVPSVTF